MPSCANSGKPACLPSERWQSRARTAQALYALTLARFVVEFLPFERWRSRIGGMQEATASDLDSSRRLAAHVDWAARLLPFEAKCLPRAIALSWLLRRKGLGHAVVIAVRPEELRPSRDALHAWVQVGQVKVMGDLPGPWIEAFRIG